MLPFSFQKGNKSAGCEDAPPIADIRYSVVCDGLGGAGITRHKIEEDGSYVLRTSGYVGSRAVADSVTDFYNTNYDRIEAIVSDECDRSEALPQLVEELKSKINDDLSDKMSVLGIDPMLTRNKTLKIFPTTLASALYFYNDDRMRILAVWAGDSRIYVLSRSKGLQLLSLDDALNAESEMNSASEMNNCISAGNPFRLNYSVFDLEEPGIVFCCSDGCFDYLKSPLHFEWLLLQTITTCVQEAEGDELGAALAAGIRDTVYQSIGDDTTMVGIIYRISSTNEMKNIFSVRMAESQPLALEMHAALNDLKTCQDERDSAAKKCRLFEEKVISDLQLCVTEALLNKEQTMLRSYIGTLPCYSDYEAGMNEITQQIDQECLTELKELSSRLTDLKKVCEDMILRDFLKWRRLNQEAAGPSSVMDFFAPRTRAPQKKNHVFMNPSYCLQLLHACVQLFNQPDFESIGMQISLPRSEVPGYIQSQTNSIEALITIMENNSPLFEDMWGQAYFSTDIYEKERQSIARSQEYREIAAEALKAPSSSRVISELTSRKIDSYRKMNNSLIAIQQKYQEKRTQMAKAVPEQFFARHEKEIVESFFRLSVPELESIFSDTGMRMERLISFIEARHVITDDEQRVGKAQDKVTSIWDAYRSDYQLFRLVTERGVV